MLLLSPVARILYPFIQYYGVFFTVPLSPHNGTSLSSVGSPRYISHPSFAIFPFCRVFLSLRASRFLLRRNASRYRDVLAAGGFESLLPQGEMWNAYLQGLPLVDTCKTNKKQEAFNEEMSRQPTPCAFS